MLPTRAQLLQQFIATITSSVEECLAIYRFGSWDTPHQRAESDIDLAFLAPSAVDELECWNLAQRLASVANRNVDLINLSTASTVMQIQIITTGERIYCSDTYQVELFEDTVFSAYARLNEERNQIIGDIKRRGAVYDQ